ncbi:MAG: hypothetical protein A2600_09150 [Candidatus Lambdaproteobacteria bacterium RIFOXYD1_FULL_56_27]|uniref:Tetratricopeptide repeat protein n=1 Tax=Candidatus Lambdaproteobacteria bacterium RIFOXYD2_FULL_56_26 TaxID=1817773 RepID=A0A1F6GLD1_9PROT|nr:MAG: hypothetical protein A2557_13275 [Candidatus Lambdaproteobacteria bacterium RIFOXYD2_FULL_56_26]OGH03584.1 MAG: hypothetical protein A2426_06460 [Candidatus Lambdaproteobacteria bacterium RIFOXYC1_FULL_56_13]OGH08721.1 MAG: hypothetical protein A2600_09150 [Candidatus Lambdaproteobacteria bacterium RIFOXYD1_FULL_56_27]
MELMNGLLPSGKKKKAEQLIVQALVKLDDKNNDEALACFRQAILLGQDKIGPYMRNLFNGFVSNRRHAEALAIGRPLASFYEEDAGLANELGNQTRHLGDSEQARNWYKKAIQINPKFELPYLNTAALVAKVARFDGEIKPMIEQFLKVKDFIVPPMLGGKGTIAMAAKEILAEQGHPAALEVKEVNQLSALVDPEELLNLAGKRALEAIHLATAQTAQHQEIRNNHLVNLALFALEQNQLPRALDAVGMLERVSSDYRYTPLLRAILNAKAGRLEPALEILKTQQAARPEDRYLNANLGLVYKKMGKHQQASVFFIRASYLLEKSYGFYSSEEIETLAKEFYHKRQFKEALGLYQVIAETDPQPSAWLHMSHCLYQLKKLSQSFQIAKEGYGKAAELSPEAKEEFGLLAKNFFLEEAEGANKSKVFDKALTLIEFALFFDRSIEMLDRAAQIAYKAGDSYKAAQFQEEQHALQGLDQVEQQEAKRQRYIALGREQLAKKEFQSAVHNFELAFDMKLDKDVFVFLASIYKKLKQPRALNNLMRRWKWMLEQEKEKEEERQKALAEKETVGY